MTAPADVLIGVVPVVLAAAFLVLIVQSMGDRATGLVDKMKQAVGGAVMLLVALLVVFAFLGGGGGDDPGPEPPEEYDVLFYVASDSQGYGTVSIQGLSDVPDGTAVTVGQTLTVSRIGQCTATPAASTSEYTYAFSHWTGADNPSTPAPTTISGNTAYYAHFTRTEITPPEPDTFTVSFAVATDSIGYGSVSIASLADVVDGTTATIGQTIVIGSAGQCTATPAADTAQYSYAFAGWTGADDSSTQAPTTIIEDVTYYAHFTRSEITPTPMDPSLFTYTVADGEATVTGWAGTPPADGYDLWFPDTDGQGHPLTAIGGSSSSTYVSVFAGAKTLRADTATEVGDRAFIQAALLESVDLPSATSIGSYAFRGCTSLASVDLPVATSIGNRAFSECTSLASVDLPAATSVGDGCFYGCTSLASVDLPATTSIGNRAFESCSSLASVDLPAATSIGSYAFSVCTSLASVDLPAATSIGAACFGGCTSLASVAFSAPVSFGDNTFQNCSAIESVTFGSITGVTVYSFPDWTFYDTDGTTVLSKTATNLANSTFIGTASALIKVAPGAKSLSPQMQERALELAAENSLKASMLADLDPELAEMDPTDVARMTVEQIRALTPEDVEDLKAEIERRRALPEDPEE